MTAINPVTAFEDLSHLRQHSPLVHNITNYVVMNTTANALLAIGASPVMAHALEEAGDMAAIAGSLVVNIGTLEPEWVRAMDRAMHRAKALNKPIVFDPVGMGATPYRNRAVKSLFDGVTPDIVRGNASEILALAGQTLATKGVDSTASSQEAREVAQNFALRKGCVVVVSGATDLLTDGVHTYEVANGHPLMGKVTGMGCSATALVAAVAAVQHEYLRAAASGMLLMGVAGEMAAEESKGPGSFPVNLLDTLNGLNERDLRNQCRIKAL